MSGRSRASRHLPMRYKSLNETAIDWHRYLEYLSAVLTCSVSAPYVHCHSKGVAMEKRFSWKSNYLRIPLFVQSALNDIDGDLIAVAATKKINRKDIEAGQYGHVGLSIEGSSIIAAGRTQPPADPGKWSETRHAGTYSITSRCSTTPPGSTHGTGCCHPSSSNGSTKRKPTASRN